MKERKGSPTILYVEDDGDTRPVLKQLLRREGYRVIADECEEDALERADDGNQFDADLILLDLGQAPDEVIAAGRRIRKQLKTNDVPIVVIAYKYGEDMEGKNINVEGNEWVTYLEDCEQLQNLLGQLC